MSTLINPFRTEESDEERRRREAEEAFDRQLAERDAYMRPTAPAAPPQDIPPPNLPEIVEDEFEFSTDPAEVEAPPVTYDDVGQGIQQAMLSPLERLRERQQTPPPAPGASIPHPSPQQSAAPPGAGPAGATPPQPPGADVQPTTNPQQAAVAGAQAAQLMAPAGPAMPPVDNAAPQFATGGAPMGGGSPALDLRGTTDERIRLAARRDDDRTRRRQRILQAVLGAFALRSMQRGGNGGLALPALMAARMGSAPAQAEARLNADEERRQAMLQQLFENRQAVAGQQAEMSQFERQQAERERAARATEADRAAGRAIQRDAETRQSIDYATRETNPQAWESARRALASAIAGAPPDAREHLERAYPEEAITAMSVRDLRAATREAGGLWDSELGNPNRGRGGGGGGAPRAPDEVGGVNTPPASWLQARRQELRAGFEDGPSIEEADALAMRVWQGMTAQERLDAIGSDQRQAGRRLRGYTYQGEIEAETIREARQAMTGSRRATAALSELIYLIENASNAEEAAGLLGLPDASAVAARVARLESDAQQGMRSVYDLGALDASDRAQLGREIAGFSALGSLMRRLGTGRATYLRQLIPSVYESAHDHIETLGFRRVPGQWAVRAGFNPDAARRRREESRQAADAEARGDAPPQPTQRTQRQGVAIVITGPDGTVHLRRRVPESAVAEYERRARSQGWTLRRGGAQ